MKTACTLFLLSSSLAIWAGCKDESPGQPVSSAHSGAATSPDVERIVRDVIALADDANEAVRRDAREKLLAMLRDKTLDSQTRARIQAAINRTLPVYLVCSFDSNEAARRRNAAAKEYGLDQEITLDLGKHIMLRLVLIPPGRFLMGSGKEERMKYTKSFSPGAQRDDEGPEHEVLISRPFYMGVYSVTQEQYLQVMGKNPSYFKRGGSLPVESLLWKDANEFCGELSRKTGRLVTLPTEAQWEWACRAGSQTDFGFGDDSNKLAEYAWYSDNCHEGWQQGQGPVHPVGLKKPNAWGLYDMHGNVQQWCSDWYDSNYFASSPKTDPQGPRSGDARVTRGGSWQLTPAMGDCRSASRSYCRPDYHSPGLGLRVVVVIDKR